MNELLEKFYHGDRNALAKIITILESKEGHGLNFIKNANISIRIAISGPPGVGKSTFINSLGKIILEKGYKLAIIAIDPSSEISHGSILGDKTRMTDLLANPKCFIRPSPSGTSLSGINTTTKDVITALESFGFEVIIIETVGVGQSESLAYSLSDHFLMLLEPGAGDDIQAIKKGNLELADFILINKYDEEYKNLAQKTFYILKSEYADKIFLISSKNNIGIADLLDKIFTHKNSVARAKKLEKYIKYVFFEKLKKDIEKRPDFNLSIESISLEVEEKAKTLDESLLNLLKLK